MNKGNRFSVQPDKELKKSIRHTYFRLVCTLVKNMMIITYKIRTKNKYNFVISNGMLRVIKKICFFVNGLKSFV